MQLVRAHQRLAMAMAPRTVVPHLCTPSEETCMMCLCDTLRRKGHPVLAWLPVLQRRAGMPRVCAAAHRGCQAAATRHQQLENNCNHVHHMMPPRHRCRHFQKSTTTVQTSRRLKCMALHHAMLRYAVLCCAVLC